MAKKIWKNVQHVFDTTDTTTNVKAMVDDILSGFTDVNLTRVRFTGDYNGTDVSFNTTSYNTTLSYFSTPTNAQITSVSQMVTSFAFAFNDELQASSPIYIKIDVLLLYCGNGTNTHTWDLGVAIDVGNSIDSAGNVKTNGAEQSKYIGYYGYAGTVAVKSYTIGGDCYSCYSGDYFGISYGNYKTFLAGSSTDSRYTKLGFFVERVPGGFVFLGERNLFRNGSSYNSSSSAAYGSVAGAYMRTAVPANLTSSNACMGYLVHITTDTSRKTVCNMYAQMPYPYKTRLAVGIPYTALTMGTSFDAKDDQGITRKYLALTGSSLNLWGSAVAPAMRWE